MIAVTAQKSRIDARPELPGAGRRLRSAESVRRVSLRSTTTNRGAEDRPAKATDLTTSLRGVAALSSRPNLVARQPDQRSCDVGLSLDVVGQALGRDDGFFEGRRFPPDAAASVFGFPGHIVAFAHEFSPAWVDPKARMHHVVQCSKTILQCNTALGRPRMSVRPGGFATAAPSAPRRKRHRRSCTVRSGSSSSAGRAWRKMRVRRRRRSA